MVAVAEVFVLGAAVFVIDTTVFVFDAVELFGVVELVELVDFVEFQNGDMRFTASVVAPHSG
jgi:hypothetical protein